MTNAAQTKFQSLSDRYSLQTGWVPLSGIQGIIRALIEIRRYDIKSGLNTSAFVSGYQGSPLGGLDTELLRAHKSIDSLGIVFHPGLNEELGATSIIGTQLLASNPSSSVDGVTGIWYGKSPGVDRASDAIRHGNLIGASSKGGVLVLAGDDPAAKSSTVPGSSDASLAAMGLPVLFPGNTHDLINLALHGIALSRASGLWSGFKVVTKVADSTGIFPVGADFNPIIPTLDYRGTPYHHIPDAELLGAHLLELEERLLGIRLDIAKEYIYQNKLNPTTRSSNARLGIVAVGTVYHDLLTALTNLGIADSDDIAIKKMMVTYPLDERDIIEFANGLEEILVIEEKPAFVERQIKEILYGRAQAPIITGKKDDRNNALVPSHGALESDDIAKIVGRRYLSRHQTESIAKYLDKLTKIDSRELLQVEQRTPFFCSGCPHNTSTRTGDSNIVGAGIGCHTLILLNPRGRGEITGVTQMGGEGAQFIGMAPYLPGKHFIQNMGDGTFHHSGSLAIRAAVAAKIPVTYKILYNDAVAMTGGQRVEGQLTIPEMIESLYLEGVSKVVVTTDNREAYDGVSLPRGTAVFDRGQLDKVQSDLSKINGVSVIIHDQLCAIEKRRRRRQGTLDAPKTLIVINERTCEGCGDCGDKSNCLSVEPVITEFGRKTRINQGSCSSDQTCLQGDCPSFMTIPNRPKSHKPIALPNVDLVKPNLKGFRGATNIRLVGIGGTGVVTLAAIIEVACILDGKYSRGLDQTGLSQKAGPVISDIVISSSYEEGSAPLTSGGADLILGFDLIGTAAAKNLKVADRDRTIAIVSSSVIPTGRQVTDVKHAKTPDSSAIEMINEFTRIESNRFIPAQELSDILFLDQIPANVIMFGAAWQLGLIPLSLEAIDSAFKLNGANLKTNQDAFAWGRIAITHPDKISELIDPMSARNQPTHKTLTLVKEALPINEQSLVETVAIRYEDLIRFQNKKLAKNYLSSVATFAKSASSKFDNPTKLIDEFARGLYKFTAYKDEYEVARLHLEWVASQNYSESPTILLHPPILRSLGMKNKIKLNKSAAVAMPILARCKVLRGGKLDVFGKTPIRKEEAKLALEYRETITNALDIVSVADYAIFLELVMLYDKVRGYEEIKLANLDRYRARVREIQETLAQSKVSKA